jgi:hypothetical protein
VGDEGVAVSSWVEATLLELLDDETPEYRVVKAMAREALKMAIKEAARRCRNLYLRGEGMPRVSSEDCALAIEAMLVDDPQAKEGGR